MVGTHALEIRCTSIKYIFPCEGQGRQKNEVTLLSNTLHVDGFFTNRYKFVSMNF